MAAGITIRRRIGRAFIFFLLMVSPRLSAEPPLTALIQTDDGQEISTAEARSRLLAAAGEYLGAPYRYGGLNRQGMDCSGLIYMSFRDALGISSPRTTRALYDWVERIPDDLIQRGDLVFFNTTGGISHAGIYAGDSWFIHAASSGPKRGVIYSRLDEAYWRRTYVGAGRALPEWEWEGAEIEIEAEEPERVSAAKKSGGNKAGPLLAGLAFAASWWPVRENEFPLRGVTAGFLLACDLPLSKRPPRLGLELRPMWDAALEVFRLPLTFSLGMGSVFSVFAGPVLTLGEPARQTSDGERRYTGGTTWLGEAGIALAPLSFPVKDGVLSFYGEFAWQSYSRDPALNIDWAADISAALRISTGLRYIWRL